jgi:hypothetical protein
LVFVLLLAGAPAWSGQPWKKRWIASAAALAGATLLDAWSSMGHYEANPLLRNSNGQFAPARAMAIKAGATTSTLLLQALLARTRPQLYKPCSLANTAAVVTFTAAAWKNASH